MSDAKPTLIDLAESAVYALWAIVEQLEIMNDLDSPECDAGSTEDEGGGEFN